MKVSLFCTDTKGFEIWPGLAALAWNPWASAFQNPKPSPWSRLRLGHGLTSPRPGLLQQIPGGCPLLLPHESTHTSIDVGMHAHEVEQHCLGWGAALSSFVGSSSSDHVCVQGWRAPRHLHLQMVEWHCLGWDAVSSSCMGSSSSDCVCVQGWRAPHHLHLQMLPPTFTVVGIHCSPCMWHGPFVVPCPHSQSSTLFRVLMGG